MSDSQKDKAYLLYSSGVKCADIARELGVTPNTISTWKSVMEWDKKITTEGSIAEKFIHHLDNLTMDDSQVTKILHEVIKRSINEDKLKPTKWKDVLDTLDLLVKLSSKSPIGRGKPDVPRTIEELPDGDLDKEIEALSTLVELEQPEAEIIINEDGTKPN